MTEILFVLCYGGRGIWNVPHLSPSFSFVPNHANNGGYRFCSYVEQYLLWKVYAKSKIKSSLYCTSATCSPLLFFLLYLSVSFSFPLPSGG